MNFALPRASYSPVIFEPQIQQGSSHPPYPLWSSLEKPPPNGWWASRQRCRCPPCYFFSLRQQIDQGELPLSVSGPLSQLMDVGLIRLNFNHPNHSNSFTGEDEQYAMAAYRSLCIDINGGQLPRQLLEILKLCSEMAVFKALSREKPEFDRKEFEMRLKRALDRSRPIEVTFVGDEEKGEGREAEEDEEIEGKEQAERKEQARREEEIERQEESE